MRIIEFGNVIRDDIVLTIGYFDSIHLGHRKLIEKVKEDSARLGVKSAALIFVGGLKNGGDIFSLDERISIINSFNLDFLIIATINDDFLKISKKDFIDKLMEIYSLKEIVCGYDFTFGYKAEGTSDYLKSEIAPIPLEVICEVKDEGGIKISSSRIKELLLDGRIKDANKFLGFDYFISGKVVHGKENGRKLGFPTINITLPIEKMKIREGVYQTYLIIDGKRYKGITNLGSQPTFDGDSIVVETHIKDFNGNLYGKDLSVFFIDKIRDIKKFESAKELKAQLEIDLKFGEKI